MAVVARETKPVEPFTKLRQPSRLRLVDGVAHSLEDGILSGRMRPGERLIETKLCEELNVSRTTLREALLMLERRGLVRSEPRRGTFVTRLSREESMDLCATRAILEAYAVSIGFERFDDAVFARLEALLDNLATCVLPDDTPRVIQIDHAFHRLLIDGCDSRRIRELWASLDGEMSALILSSIEHHHAGIDDVVGFHRVLLDAIRSGDPEVAREGVIVHYIGADGQGQNSLSEMEALIAAMARRTRARRET
jgi:DNA-binding GntR family transcriptional regulator